MYNETCVKLSSPFVTRHVMYSDMCQANVTTYHKTCRVQRPVSN